MGYSGQVTYDLEQILPRNVNDLTITDDLYMQEENDLKGEIQMHAIRTLLKRSTPPELERIHLLMRESGYDLSRSHDVEREAQDLSTLPFQLELTLLGWKEEVLFHKVVGPGGISST